MEISLCEGALGLELLGDNVPPFLSCCKASEAYDSDVREALG